MAGAFGHISDEIEALRVYMENDRQNYLVEADVQADGMPAYLIHFCQINSFEHPRTLELINVGLSVSNVAYMAYKAHYRRVRPSVLCPGLTVPFGPPSHPAFPSGHSFTAHFLSLLLLEIPGLYCRYGVQDPAHAPGSGELLRKPVWSDLNGRAPIPSPLLDIAQRMAVNRERIGVHYPSDSYGSRHLAAGLWDVLIHQTPQNPAAAGPIACPTLLSVLEQAKAEWPLPAGWV